MCVLVLLEDRVQCGGGECAGISPVLRIGALRYKHLDRQAFVQREPDSLPQHVVQEAIELGDVAAAVVFDLRVAMLVAFSAVEGVDRYNRVCLDLRPLLWSEHLDIGAGTIRLLVDKLP